MSRSYKKKPIYTARGDAKTAKFYKRKANKKIRKLPLDALGGKSKNYRKAGLDTWDVCDYRMYGGLFLKKEDWEEQEWKKWYYRK